MLGYSWDYSQDCVVVPNLDESERICDIMGVPFVISQEQRAFCEKRGLALPTRCPPQKFKERIGKLSFSNMRVVNCALSNKPLRVWDNNERTYLSGDVRY